VVLLARCPLPGGNLIRVSGASMVKVRLPYRHALISKHEQPQASSSPSSGPRARASVNIAVQVVGDFADSGVVGLTAHVRRCLVVRPRRGGGRRGLTGASMVPAGRRPRRPRPQSNNRLCPECWSVAGEPCRTVLNTHDGGTMKRGGVLDEMHAERAS
jgi:hypothetical protein